MFFEQNSGNHATNITRGTHRIAELDGLRGVAIGLVIALHLIIRPNHALWKQLLGAPLYRLLDMAWCGVDIFFVLSGFLIGGIIIDNRDSTNFYQAFYSRRATRIFPAYFLLVGIAFISLGPIGIHASSGNIPFIAYPTFSANLFTSLGFVPAYWLGPLWSVCIEEQFYLAAPLLLRIVSRSLVPWLVIATVLGSAGLRTAWSLDLVPHTFSYWDFTLTRLDGLGLGVLAAWLVRDPRFLGWGGIHARFLKLSLVALALICVWFSQQPNRLLLGPGILVISLTAFLAILALKIRPNSLLAKALRASPLVSLGRYSYFLYLFHMPVFWFAQVLLLQRESTAPFTIPASLVAVWVFAVLSWRHFESPLLRVGHCVPYDRTAREAEGRALP